MKNFSLILPTRNHVALVYRLLNNLVETTDVLNQIEVVLYIDEDDLASQRIEHALVPLVKVIQPKNTMGYMTQACFEASSGRYIVLLNDDAVIRTTNWDRKVLAAFLKFPDEIVLVYCNDLYYGKSMSTFPILPRKTCELMDKICPVDFQRHCIDPHVFDVFSRLSMLGHSRFVYLADVIFEHMHYDFGISMISSEVYENDDSIDQQLYSSLSKNRHNIALRMAEHIEKFRKNEVLLLEKSETVSIIVLANGKMSNDLEDYLLRQKQMLREVIVAGGEAGLCRWAFHKQMGPKLKFVQVATRTKETNLLHEASSCACGDFIVFISGNSVPQPGWLEALLETANDNSVGAVGSTIINPRSGCVEDIGIGFLKNDQGTLKKTYIYYGFPPYHPVARKKRVLQAVSLVGMLVKRGLFCKVGGLNEKEIGNEAFGLCVEISKLGKKIVNAPDAVIYGYVSDRRHDGDDNGLKSLKRDIKPDLEGILKEDKFSFGASKKVVLPSFPDHAADKMSGCAVMPIPADNRVIFSHSVSQKKLKSIGIDIRMSFHTGIGRYIRGFVGALDADFIDIKLLANRGNLLCEQFGFDARYIQSQIYTVQEQLTVPFSMRGLDSLHVPHFNVPVLWRKKLIVTIHDLIHLRFPEYRSRPLVYSYAKGLIRYAVKKADAIIVVSEFSKDDIVRTFDAKPEKIIVIYHGIDAAFLSYRSAVDSTRSNEPYFLYVGLLKAHKNVGTLIKAFQKIRDEKIIPNLKLKLIGKLDRKQVIVQMWERMIQNDPDISLETDVDESVLRERYQNAIALVQPSFYEGFGFPVVEAMASGTPVIGANMTSIPEIMGEGNGLLFDPNSEAELIDRMRRMIQDQTQRKMLIDRGLKHARSFSWKVSAEKHMQVYRTVLGV